MNLPKNSRWNKLKWGWISGIILPVIVFFIIYLYEKKTYSFLEYISLTYKMGIITKIMTLSLVGLLPAFHFFLNREWYIGARGVIFALLTWALIIFIVYFTMP